MAATIFKNLPLSAESTMDTGACLYSIVLYVGLPLNMPWKLQLLQDIVAGLLTGTSYASCQGVLTCA